MADPRKPSQADEAHIATAEYGRKQQAAIDRIGKLKALRLAREATQPAKSKPKQKTPTVNSSKAPAYRRWGA
jgi:hypothetical protein